MWFPLPCYDDMQGDFMYYSYAGNIAFVGFLDFLMAAGITLVLLPIVLEMIPLPYLILTWSGWLPLAKASFSIYFTHLTVMRGIIATEQYGFTMTHINLFADFVLNVTAEIFIGVLVYLFVEVPSSRLLTLLIRPRKTIDKKQPLLDTELKSQA